MREERRLVWRVLGQWREISNTGRFPRRAEIDPWLKGEDGANCLLIAIGWSVELTQPVVIGINLAAILCPPNTLAELLLSMATRVVPARRGLVVEGGAVLRGVDILYRAALLPISGDRATIDYVLGATNYRSLNNDEQAMRSRTVQEHWI